MIDTYAIQETLIGECQVLYYPVMGTRLYLAINTENLKASFHIKRESPYLGWHGESVFDFQISSPQNSHVEIQNAYAEMSLAIGRHDGRPYKLYADRGTSGEGIGIPHTTEYEGTEWDGISPLDTELRIVKHTITTGTYIADEDLHQGDHVTVVGNKAYRAFRNDVVTGVVVNCDAKKYQNVMLQAGTGSCDLTQSDSRYMAMCDLKVGDRVFVSRHNQQINLHGLGPAYVCLESGPKHSWLEVTLNKP